MPIQNTNEFSVCLTPIYDAIDAVNKIRKQLTPSPYRDDPPHATLVRGIVSDKRLSDAELLKQVAEITRIDNRLPLTATITDVANKSNKFYSESSGFIISPSDELRLFRQSLLKSLTAKNFSDESYDRNDHDLHITIRLGVKLEGDMLAQAKKQFLNTQIEFVGWFLNRLELDGDSRKMHVVKPTNP